MEASLPSKLVSLQYMVTVLTGDNMFALRAALDALIVAFSTDHGDIAVERLDGEEAAFERLQESLQSLPFLAARKLVILRTPGVNKLFVEHVEQLLGGLPETTDLVIVEPRIDKRSSYYKYLKKSAELQEYTELDENGLARWLVDTSQQQGSSLRLADARLIVERVGANQQLLVNERDKLLLYSPTITRETIELLIDATPQSKIFDLLEAAFVGNTKRALELYHDQRAQKVDPSQIIAMLAWQLRILALLLVAGSRTQHDIISTAKLSPYIIQKSQIITNRLTLPGLRKLVQGLLDIDTRSKRQSIDLDEALQNYLLQVGDTAR
jgi:DNA polymerase-3 subunit delta